MDCSFWVLELGVFLPLHVCVLAFTVNLTHIYRFRSSKTFIWMDAEAYKTCHPACARLAELARSFTPNVLVRLGASDEMHGSATRCYLVS